jgi:hypothetical protein
LKPPIARRNIDGVLDLFFNAVFAAALWLGVKRKRNRETLK